MTKFIAEDRYEKHWHAAGGIYYIPIKGTCMPGPVAATALEEMGIPLRQVRSIRDLKHMRRLPNGFRFYINPMLHRAHLDNKPCTGISKLSWMLKIARRKKAVLLNL